MHALKSLTRQRQYSQFQKVISLLAAAVLCVGALHPTAALAQGQPKPPVFKSPATFCTVGKDNGDCVNSSPMGLAIADLIGNDGYPEVVVANNVMYGSITVFRNTQNWDDPQDGLVRAAVYVGGMASPTDVAVADMGTDYDDHTPDGYLDLVATAMTGDKLLIRYNDGNGQFPNTESVFLNTDDPLGLVLWDFDQNGTVDIAVATHEQVGEQWKARAELAFREADPGEWDHRVFEAPTPGSAIGIRIAAGYVRQPPIPGRLDLVMTTNLDKIFVLLNDGNRNFNTNPPPGFEPVQDASFSFGLALGKFRPGGFTTPDDLALSAVADHEAEVYFADASANFEWDRGYELADGTSPLGVDVGRINADTKNDFVVALSGGEPCSPGGGIAVFLGYGDGTFREPPYLFCVDPGNNPKPQFVKIGDLDQGGFTDIVTSNNNSDNISVLINALEAVPPEPGP